MSHPASQPVSLMGTPHKDFGSSAFLLHHNPMTSSPPSSAAKQQIDVEVRMASVCYVHSASFLDELNSCATDFKVSPI